LLIAADQEGGSVYRLGTGTALPGNMALGATYELSGTKYAYEAGKIIGSELSVLGINVNLAPVVDVNNNPNNPVIGLRSYSDDATAVGQLASAQIAGMKQFQVIGCVKHFPGHGDTATDSHYGLPVVDKSLEQLLENELKPYEIAIAEGVEMVMAAHILYPQLEQDRVLSQKTGKEEALPATLSDDIITGLLKEQMGFPGVVITDAMNMAGITDTFLQTQAAVLAISAGVDMLCMPTSGVYTPQDLSRIDDIIDSIAQAVEQGKIPQSRIDDAVTRILTLKKDRGILSYDPKAYTLEKAQTVVGGEENRRMERQMAAAAVTVVRNDKDTLPLKIAADSKVLVLVPYNNEMGQIVMAWNRAHQAGLIPEGAQLEVKRFQKTDSGGYSNHDKGIQWADVVIVISEISSANRYSSTNSNNWLYTGPNGYTKYAKSLGKATVVMSADKPYDVQMYPYADAVLAVYGCKGSSVDPTEALIGGVTATEQACGPNIIAGMEVALGIFGATGKLPVNVYEYDIATKAYTQTLVYQRGYGLTYDPLAPKDN
jgi:beta-N-acetylhexosaminidase